MHRNADGGISREFLKSCDMSLREVITSISANLIPECIMSCEATQRMLDLKLALRLPSICTPARCLPRGCRRRPVAGGGALEAGQTSGGGLLLGEEPGC